VLDSVIFLLALYVCVPSFRRSPVGLLLCTLKIALPYEPHWVQLSTPLAAFTHIP
jgi:hypothetical protein